ncbi:MAG TPA: SCO family protein [Terriglobales bacterium]
MFRNTAAFVRAMVLVTLWSACSCLSLVAQSHWGADYFPNVTLVTQDGEAVKFYDDLLKGKIVAIDLIYTNCEYSCPLETARLAQVQKLLGDRVGKDIFFYSISIDPAHDTPAKLKEYAKEFHAGPGWLFLTGKKSDIDLVSKKLGLYADPSINRDGHTTYLMIGDVPNGQWMRNSAVDNAHFLTAAIQDVLDHGKAQTASNPSYADAKPLTLTHQGQYLFATRCSACHTVGHGDKVGPDLMGVTTARDRAWLAKIIQRPEQLLGAKDPLATSLLRKYHNIQMPNLNLGPEDVQYLIAYLESESVRAANAKP